MTLTWVRRKGQRGRMPTYGKQTISLAKRAGQKRGWQEVVCTQYGKVVTKTVKVFQATWTPVAPPPAPTTAARCRRTCRWWSRRAKAGRNMSIPS